VTALAIRERDFEDRVIAEAKLRGWLCAHFRPAMNRRGRWSTPMQGHPGFPDVVMVRPPRVIFAELKAEKGRVSPDQQTWLEGLGGCAGVETYLWRPSDSDAISQVLS
jgi:hypothetical protein